MPWITRRGCSYFKKALKHYRKANDQDILPGVLVLLGNDGHKAEYPWSMLWKYFSGGLSISEKVSYFTNISRMALQRAFTVPWLTTRKNQVSKFRLLTNFTNTLGFPAKIRFLKGTVPTKNIPGFQNPSHLLEWGLLQANTDPLSQRTLRSLRGIAFLTPKRFNHNMFNKPLSEASNKYPPLYGGPSRIVYYTFFKTEATTPGRDTADQPIWGAKTTRPTIGHHQRVMSSHHHPGVIVAHTHKTSETPQWMGLPPYHPNP